MQLSALNVYIAPTMDNWQLISGQKIKIDDVNYIVNITNEMPKFLHVADNDIAGCPDLFITEKSLQDVPIGRQLIVPRYSKSVQAALIKEANLAQPDLYPNLLQIPSWSSPGSCREIPDDDNGRSYPMLLKDNCEYVIKPEMGARSAAQVVFNTKDYNAVEVVNLLRGKIDRQKAREKSETQSESSEKHRRHNFFAQEKMPENLKVFIGNATEDDAQKMIDTSGLVIQEVIKNIASEFRLIVGDNGIEAMLLRPRGTEKKSSDYSAVLSDKDKLVFSGYGAVEEAKRLGCHNEYDRDFFVALGVWSGPSASTQQHIESVVGPEIVNFITINLDLFRYNSIDLFITTDGKWGFFEFCNQFNTDDMGQTVATRIHQHWLTTAF